MNFPPVLSGINWFWSIWSSASEYNFVHDGNFFNIFFEELDRTGLIGSDIAISINNTKSNIERSITSVSRTTSNFAYLFAPLANSIDPKEFDVVVVERSHGPL